MILLCPHCDRGVVRYHTGTDGMFDWDEIDGDLVRYFRWENGEKVITGHSWTRICRHCGGMGWIGTDDAAEALQEAESRLRWIYGCYAEMVVARDRLLVELRDLAETASAGTVSDRWSGCSCDPQKINFGCRHSDECMESQCRSYCCACCGLDEQPEEKS